MPEYAYKITQRIDRNRIFQYNYMQIAAAPFLPKGAIPADINSILQELTRQKVATYRSILDFRVYVNNKHINPDSEKRLIQYILLILRLRNAFRRLIYQFLAKRCTTIPFQDVDPITLTPVVQPVIVYDMKNRIRHRFEAKPLIVHIHNQLIYTSYGFPAPQMPRNPLTNIDFTYGQLTSIYKQLTDYGLVRWTFTGFRTYYFNIDRFHKMFETPLRHAAIRNTVLVDTHDVAAEQLGAFIQIYTGHHLAGIQGLDDLESSILQYAITQRPDDSYIMCWRRLFLVALWHNIHNTPVTTRLDDFETHVQRRGVVTLTRILTTNIKNYFNEIREDYNRWAAEQEASDDDESSISYGETDELFFEAIREYVHSMYDVPPNN